MIVQGRVTEVKRSKAVMELIEENNELNLHEKNIAAARKIKVYNININEVGDTVDLVAIEKNHVLNGYIVRCLPVMFLFIALFAINAFNDDITAFCIIVGSAAIGYGLSLLILQMLKRQPRFNYRVKIKSASELEKERKNKAAAAEKNNSVEIKAETMKTEKSVNTEEKNESEIQNPAETENSSIE